MSFTQSLINQVGRDAGKVISNQLFKGSHTTPVGVVGTQKRIVKSEFEKALNFQMGFKPNTLVNKLSGVQIVLKNEMKKFISDNYLSVEETVELLSMFNDFNNKISDVYDVLKLDETKNENEIFIVDKILEQMIESFVDVLIKSINGCNLKIENTKMKPFISFVLYRTFFLKNVKNLIIYNLVSIFTLFIGAAFDYPIPFLNVISAFFAIFAYPIEKSKLKKDIQIEKKRIEVFLNLKNDIEKTLIKNAEK